MRASGRLPRPRERERAATLGDLKLKETSPSSSSTNTVSTSHYTPPIPPETHDLTKPLHSVIAITLQPQNYNTSITNTPLSHSAPVAQHVRLRSRLVRYAVTYYHTVGLLATNTVQSSRLMAMSSKSNTPSRLSSAAPALLPSRAARSSFWAARRSPP